MAHPQKSIHWVKKKYKLDSDQEAIEKLATWDAAKVQAQQCLSGETDPRTLWTYNEIDRVWEKTS